MAKPSPPRPTARQSSTHDPQAAEERRASAAASLIVGVCVVVALLIIGAAPPTARSSSARTCASSSDLDLAEIGAPASVVPGRRRPRTADRQPATTCRTAQQVTYDDAPPAFGPHWNDAASRRHRSTRKFYTAERPPRARVAGAQPRARLHDPLVRRDRRRRRRGQLTELEAHRQQVRRHRQLPLQVHGGPVDLRRTATPFPDGQHVALHPLVGRRRRRPERRADRRVAVLLRVQRRGARAPS